MVHIFAMGGGEIVRRETLPLDRAVVEAADARTATVLFLPTASRDAPRYVEVFEDVYGDELDCRVEVLELARDPPSTPALDAAFEVADVVYVGGGNVEFMLEMWNLHGIPERLREAAESGTVMAGLSAGGQCWFERGLTPSESLDFDDPNVPYLPHPGMLGWYEGITFRPHGSAEKSRRHFETYLRAHDVVGLRVDDNCAIEIRDDEYRVHSATESAAAYLAAATEDGIVERRLDQRDSFVPVDDLRAGP